MGWCNNCGEFTWVWKLESGYKYRRICRACFLSQRKGNGQRAWTKNKTKGDDE